MIREYFVWDKYKELLNIAKHGVDFEVVQTAFFDLNRIIAIDGKHSKAEERYFCIGATAVGICTVRFVYREGKIRILGAGLWRKGKKLYEKENR